MDLADFLSGIIPPNLPDDATVTLPLGWLRHQRAEAADRHVGPVDERPHLLILADLARHYRRSVSTVRAWCEAGRFPGAYRLNRKGWRVPAAALAQFDAAQRQAGRDEATATAPASLRPGQGLGDWRRNQRGGRSAR